MTTCLVIGDPHIKVSNSQEIKLMSELILKQAKQLQPTFIVVLGDTLHDHESAHTLALTEAIELLLGPLSDITKTYLIIGNHDLQNPKQFLSNVHPFAALKRWGKCMTVVDKPVVDKINEHTFTFVPFVEPGRFFEALTYVQGWEESTAIFCHQEFKGSEIGNQPSVIGDDWPSNHPDIITGHIHHFHIPQSNILYTGTPIQHTYGDNPDKTISYFEFIKAIKESLKPFKHTRIDLGIPKKYTVNLSCKEVANFVPESGIKLKIKIKGYADEITSIKSDIKVIEWKKLGYKLDFITINQRRTKRQSTKKTVSKLSYYQQLYYRIQIETTDSIEIPALESVPQSNKLKVLTNIFGPVDVKFPLELTTNETTSNKSKINIIGNTKKLNIIK